MIVGEQLETADGPMEAAIVDEVADRIAASAPIAMAQLVNDIDRIFAAYRMLRRAEE